MVANATMVQACTRELKTGETRTSLVNKAGEEAASEPHSAMYRDFEWQGQGRQVGPHAYGGMRFASYGMLVCYVNIGTVCRRFRSR